MKTVYGSRAYDLKAELIRSLVAIYANAQREQITHKDLYERVDRSIYQNADYKRLPDWVKNAIRSADHALYDLASQTMTTFAHYIDGEVCLWPLSSHPRWDEFVKRQRAGESFACGTVWNNSNTWFSGPDPL